MKKLLSILLVLVLAFSMVACSTGNNEKDSKKHSEKDAEKVVEAFMDAVIEFDGDKTADLVIDKDDLSDLLKMNKEERIEEGIVAMMASMPAEFAEYEEDFREIFINLVEDVLKEISYEIKENKKEDDDEYVFTVELTQPDMGAIDFDAIMEEELAEYDMESLLNEYLESGILTEYSTEEEVMEVLMPDMINIISDAISNIEFENTKTEEFELVVKLEDDEWLIDAKDSDLKALDETLE